MVVGQYLRLPLANGCRIPSIADDSLRNWYSSFFRFAGDRRWGFDSMRFMGGCVRCTGAERSQARRIVYVGGAGSHDPSDHRFGIAVLHCR